MHHHCPMKTPSTFEISVLLFALGTTSSGCASMGAQGGTDASAAFDLATIGDFFYGTSPINNRQMVLSPRFISATKAAIEFPLWPKSVGAPMVVHCQGAEFNPAHSA